MINEIRRRLEAGEKVELECTERSLFLNVNDGVVFDENLEILESGLVVDRVSGSTISLLGCPHPIMVDGIEYFKIKESKKTFHDLVDVAVQAVKDGVIFSTEIFEDAIYICLDRSEYDTRNPLIGIVDGLETDMETIPDVISKINTLYTETFVIESEKDMLRIKSNAEIALTNGEKITSAGIINNLLSYFSLDEDGEATRNNYVEFTFIKGATVTQKKTNN